MYVQRNLSVCVRVCVGGDLQAHGRVEQVLQLLGVLRLGTGGGRCGARTSHVAVVL